MGKNLLENIKDFRILSLNINCRSVCSLRIIYLSVFKVLVKNFYVFERNEKYYNPLIRFV